MALHGQNFVGSKLSADGSKVINAENPVNGETLTGDFIEATESEINKSCELAKDAFEIYRNKSGKERAAFLRKIAEKVMDLGDELVERAMEETGLPEGRIRGERGRTCGQLNLFADVAEEGSWVNARIDQAIPNREPLPKPDVRYMERAIGPVAVFGASNFPLAFSTAGGDTASALAAGCSVVLKAHPAHPGTAELVASAAISAAKECDMPEGIISMVHGLSHNVGQTLVEHPAIKAVGFTGSIPGGRAIFDIAARRPEPIPVYAEMGSSNPVFILPQALQTKMADITSGMSGSICLGAGQFCTNPGMTILLESAESEELISKLADALSNSPAGTMVHSSIKNGYEKELNAKLEASGVELVARSSATTDNPATAAQPTLFRTSYANYKNNPELNKEVFGPCTFVITCKDKAELVEFIEGLEGHLTSTVHGDGTDFETYGDLLNLLEKKAGRLIINQYPTGVEICASMLHGGPYPASTDSRTTSVGTAAIHRYARPVCYQNFPQSLLPEELKDSNPLDVRQMINGKY